MMAMMTKTPMTMGTLIHTAVLSDEDDEGAVVGVESIEHAPLLELHVKPALQTQLKMLYSVLSTSMFGSVLQPS
jgi:hypothetical protein